MALSPVSRIGDAIDHGGSIIEGSPNVECNSIKVARLGDAVMCAIHGLQHISSASTTVKANSIGVARIGDSISCGAVIITGSSNTKAGG